MKDLVLILTLAVVVEFCWEVVGNIFKDGQLDGNLFGALLFGLIVAFATWADMFEMLSIPSKLSVVGVVISGIVISSGSSLVHEFINKLGGRK